MHNEGNVTKYSNIPMPFETSVLRRLHVVFPEHIEGDQEDVHEFFNLLLNSMIGEEKKGNKTTRCHVSRSLEIDSEMW